MTTELNDQDFSKLQMLVNVMQDSQNPKWSRLAHKNVHLYLRLRIQSCRLLADARLATFSDQFVPAITPYFLDFGFNFDYLRCWVPCAAPREMLSESLDVLCANRIPCLSNAEFQLNVYVSAPSHHKCSCLDLHNVFPDAS